ncbi:metal-dependent transcriptional regulator [Dethiosulfovibrio salsuginis]|uniref:Iron (Metal) dependent repressor, DtxR family n=1 Tax=Dethiosulfovibrio salsuginis TaxID=561720 RepID=A0A1X7J5R1_9BACT|nr:metal-dependent transcriptional regulator [Dethiosulfovibrio salsuginis]SMG22832.1 iron (metal) dependent repressor, DtxR family [Dethiosulfovibrio salsuginis]
MAITERIEDYLETVLEIELEGGVPSVTELASRLGVRKATVVVAVRKMVELGLLDHQRYGKIELTRDGREKALETYRRHQHMTFLFSQLLGLDDSVAEEMACAAEHSLDPASERRLAAFVDFCCRSRTEKKEWIVAMDRFVSDPEQLSIPLTMLLPRQEAKVLRLTTTGKPRRLGLTEKGLVPGQTVKRTDDGRGRDVQISLDGKEETLSNLDALSIWVLPVEENVG